MNNLAHLIDQGLVELYEQEGLGNVFIPHEEDGKATFRLKDVDQVANLLAILSELLKQYGDKSGLLRVPVDMNTMLVVVEEAKENEEDEERDDEDETLHVGVVVAYRVNFYTVTEITNDGVWGIGPYGEAQFIDWEDLKQYNPNLSLNS